MQRKLSVSTDKKDIIRQRWNNYIKYKLQSIKALGNQDIDFSILTLTCEGIKDVRKYLEIDELDIDNIFAVSNQSVSDEVKDLIHKEFGLPDSDFSKYFQQGRLEELLGKKIKRKFDIINLDFSNTFFNLSRTPDLCRKMNPQGLATVFEYICNYNSDFTIFLTNKIDINPITELNEFNNLNSYIQNSFKETFFFLPSDKNIIQLKSLAAILSDVSFMVLDQKHLLKNAFVTIYSPENTYWMYMAILEFEPLYESIYEYYIETDYKNKENICQCISIIRNALLKIRKI